MRDFRKIDDRLLWQELKEGNKESFNQLFRRYYSELFFYGCKLLNNELLVKESIQEVFIRIWETKDSLAEANNVKSYLLVSIRRKLLILKEKENRNQNITIDSSNSDQFILESNEFNPQTDVSKELRAKLLSAINKLTHNQREVITLFFFHELSYADIATVTGKGIQSIRNLMYRTLNNLREIIGEDEGGAIKDLYFLIISTFSTYSGLTSE